jgi:hypothetical protein
MSTAPQPPVTPGPAEPYTLSNLMPGTQPPVPPRRSRAGLVVGSLVAAAAVIGLAVGAVFVVRADDKPTATPPAAAPSPRSTCGMYGVDANTGAVVCRPAGGAPVANEGPTYAVPTKADFKLSLKILKKECFGSAGCNISFRLQVAYDKPFDPAKTYEVTYEVRGGEDPLQNTFEVNGDQATGETEEFISTARSTSKLSVVVLDVAPRSY